MRYPPLPSMPRVTFTTNIQRHLDCPPEQVDGGTVREVLDAYFARHPLARGYVLDEQGVVRTHVVVFVDAEQLADRRDLAGPVAPGAEVHVMQALSGG
jgi:molybdopterin synthase sulfur carrier subunit